MKNINHNSLINRCFCFCVFLFLSICYLEGSADAFYSSEGFGVEENVEGKEKDVSPFTRIDREEDRVFYKSYLSPKVMENSEDQVKKISQNAFDMRDDLVDIYNLGNVGEKATEKKDESVGEKADAEYYNFQKKKGEEAIGDSNQEKFVFSVQEALDGKAKMTMDEEKLAHLDRERDSSDWKIEKKEDRKKDKIIFYQKMFIEDLKDEIRHQKEVNKRLFERLQIMPLWGYQEGEEEGLRERICFPPREKPKVSNKMVTLYGVAGQPGPCEEECEKCCCVDNICGVRKVVECAKPKEKEVYIEEKRYCGDPRRKRKAKSEFVVKNPIVLESCHLANIIYLDFLCWNVRRMDLDFAVKGSQAAAQSLAGSTAEICPNHRLSARAGFWSVCCDWRVGLRYTFYQNRKRETVECKYGNCVKFTGCMIDDLNTGEFARGKYGISYHNVELATFQMYRLPKVCTTLRIIEGVHFKSLDQVKNTELLGILGTKTLLSERVHKDLDVKAWGLHLGFEMVNDVCSCVGVFFRGANYLSLGKHTASYVQYVSRNLGVLNGMASIKDEQWNYFSSGEVQVGLCFDFSCWCCWSCMIGYEMQYHCCMPGFIQRIGDIDRNVVDAVAAAKAGCVGPGLAVVHGHDDKLGLTRSNANLGLEGFFVRFSSNF